MMLLESDQDWIVKICEQPFPSNEGQDAQLSVFVVPPGNSERITGAVEVRRSRAGKSTGKRHLSGQKERVVDLYC
ncbi:hypothetical protein EYF80_005192 [Liparis tanakae]|uniref:Uncharacterized protein n=1 Tax=Liparis tanakae TaxID=230148 RepID=A0A4Z2J4U4_9TELE|nr:hypothetical protein EYF80_005192 [Liparis tanakae]